MDFGQYWQELLAVATPFASIIIYSGVKWIKNKLSGSIITNSAIAIKKELGEENYNALTGVIKDYGITKLIAEIKKLSNQFGQLKDILPLLKVLVANQIALGVYDDNPEAKEILEKIING